MRRGRLALLGLAAALVYVVYPLSTARFRIVVDATKLRARERYLATTPEREPGRHRPNVVLLLADDLGKTDISAYGGRVPTPHIDALGHEGAVCGEGYITSPICSPSRAGLLTGRYQQRFGHELQPHARYPRNRLEYWVFKYLLATRDFRVADLIAFPRFEDILEQGLPLSEVTLAEVLKREGYATAIMGKWHLGASPTRIPIRRGFDYHYGFYEAHTLYADPANPEIVNQRHDDFTDGHIWDAGRTGNCALRRNDTVVDDQVYLTERIAAESVRWLEEHRDGPFFLYVPFNAPHTPFQVPRRYYDRFASIADPYRRIYAAMIASLDDAVGDIMAALARLGLDDDTIVVFLSDNGGATYTGATDNAPLRGGKFTNFEGGINVPFLVRWRGRIAAGAACTDPVSALDVFATAVDVAGADLPTDRPYDGVSLLPYLTGRKTGAPHDALFWRSEYHKAIRKGDWKLVKDEMSGRTVLYDLGTDKVERRNVADTHADVVRDLELRLTDWENEMVSPLWPRVMDYRFADGGEVYFFPL
jgi:arylsulfatase A-like enzyme